MNDRQQTQVNVLLAVLLAGVLLAAPALVLGLLLLWWAKRGWQRVALGIAVLLGVGVLYLLHDRMPLLIEDTVWAVRDADVHGVLTNVGHFWLLTLPTAPAFALTLMVVRLRNPESAELAAERRKDEQKRRVRARASKRAATAPQQLDGDIVLGGAGDGDMVQCVKQGYFVLPLPLLQRHVVAVGGSGKGKTETILRIAVLVAKVWGWKVVYLDAKGDKDTAARFVHLMRGAGRRVAVFPEQPYDGWRGEAREIFNRLIEVEDYSEPYYKAISKLMLSLACFAPQGPPRSSTELLQRLKKATLVDLYAGRPEADDVAALQAKDANGVYHRYRALFSALGDQLNGRWSFDDVDACYIRLDGTALKEEAASVGRYLLEDYTQYVALRKPKAQHVLLVIDEWSALSKSGADVDNMFERHRSHNSHLIVSAQGYAGLGEDAERMLDAAAGIILHGADRADDLIARAGTIKVVERSVQKNMVGATGMGSLRAQEAFRVNPNDAGRLGVGECFVIADRHAQWVKVRQIEAAARAFVPTSAQSVGAEVGRRYQRQVPRGAAVEACEAPPISQGVATEPIGASYDPNGDWTVPNAASEEEPFAS